MYSVEFAIRGIKGIEQFSSLVPEVSMVSFDGEQTKKEAYLEWTLRMLDVCLEAVEETAVVVRSYSRKKARLYLRKLYLMEDFFDSMESTIKDFEPDSENERQLKEKFILFRDKFLGLVGLVEVMELSASRRKSILSGKPGKASRGSRSLTEVDLSD